MHFRCSSPPELANVLIKDVKLAETVTKTNRFTRSVSLKWFPWYKRRTQKIKKSPVQTTQYPIIAHSTSFPTADSINELSNQILQIIRKLVQKIQMLGKEPDKQVFAGFAVTIVFIAIVYFMFNLFKSLLRGISNFVAPKLIFIARKIGSVGVKYGRVILPPVYDFLRMVGFALLAITKACWHLLMEKTGRMNKYYFDSNLRSKKQETSASTVAYDRLNDDTAIVE